MANHSELFPRYIPRKAEEQQILTLLTQTQTDRQSRAVLLNGLGGVGKTILVRHIAETASQPDAVWLTPIDVDDSEYWLMPNMERQVSEELNRYGFYFQGYLEYISQMPRFEQPRIGHETVLTHLRRGEEVFYRCYEQFVEKTGKTPVITLDTVESIRGTDMLLNLTQWIKRLPATFFILAGRPPHEESQMDPLIQEFSDPYQPLPFTRIELSGFTEEETSDYLAKSGVASFLSLEEQEKLSRLTRGHPLILALTVDYLVKEGLPLEVGKNGIEQLKAWLPFQQDKIPLSGEKAYAEFVRRLVVPYRETSFWDEAIKRLAVVRRRVNEPIWERLMHDQPLPSGVANWHVAWERLLLLPWIRPRANRHYVTLHDALAEELARHIVPLQDKEGTWRREQWKAATRIYAELIENRERELDRAQAELDRDILRELPEEQQGALVRWTARLDAERRELDLLKATHFFYQMLCDFQTGCRQFIVLFDDATNRHQYRFRELLWLEMQRFLPGEKPFDPLEDAIKPVVEDFGKWFGEHRDMQYEIRKRGCQFLIDNGRPKEAVTRLDDLLGKFGGDPEKEYDLLDQRGIARMRTPGQVRLAEEDQKWKLELTRSAGAPMTLRQRQGEALKDLGLYYRNVGNWRKAADFYREALLAAPLSDQVERAAIQANWAYVQALRGHYFEALDLIEGALAVRQARNLRKHVGMALSVKGEVHRYARDWTKAWEAYQQAENIFVSLGDWSWLGLIRQEQAICLFQAVQSDMRIGGYASTEEMLHQARTLVKQALDICEDRNTRVYPSALNRAGRIFGQTDFEQGLKYLKDGIWWARQVDDYWMWFANLIEYAELNYQAWLVTRKSVYRKNIADQAEDIRLAIKEYSDFADLSGRWELLQGYLLVHDALAGGGQESLQAALDHYKRGFASIAKGPIGSHGATAIPSEFKKFSKLFRELSLATRKEWCEALREAWSNPGLGYVEDLRYSTQLLARLTELYEELVAHVQPEKEAEK